VGELGSILATRDGGRTWQIQRAGGQRAALLAIFATAADVPLALVAQTGAAESYVAAVNMIHSSAAEAEDAIATSSRAREAMLLSGAAAADSAWRFPLPAEDLGTESHDLMNALDRANDGQGLVQVERYLVRQLRMWRPDVVVTHHATGDSEKGGWGRGSAEPPERRTSGGSLTPDPSRPAAALVEQMVLRAIEAAADPARYPELAVESGLEPWQVKRVFGVLPPGVRGDVAVDTARPSAWLGETPSVWSARGRRLLFTEYVLPPDAIELKLLLSSSAEASGPAGLFNGIPLAYGSDARRPAPAPPAENINDMRRMVARRRLLRELLNRTEGNASWVGQVTTLSDGMDARSGGELLFQLAEGYRAEGRLDLAADTYFLLARRYPDHPLADRGLLWLVEFYASAESAHRAASQQATNVRLTGHVEAYANGDRRGAGETGRGGEDETRSESPPLPVSASLPLEHAIDRATTIGLSRDDRLRRAVQLAEYLKTARPLVYAEPALRFAVVCAQRRLGYSNEAKRYFLTLKPLPETSPWRRCALTEEWLANPHQAPPPKTLGTCRPATARPHLDGSLDEPMWEAADVLRLRSDSDDAPATPHGQVQLAYDSQFLYLAVSCPKTGGREYRPDDRPRPRDADLGQHDRVAIEIDIDRDYTTAFKLTVDHRGWCHDACWGDTNWNPDWYIAAAAGETSWTVEAAIPLDVLTDQPLAAKHVWAVAARRIIPRVGYEAWCGKPADADSPERFGLVIFE
jgi:hypothetical protein